MGGQRIAQYDSGKSEELVCPRSPPLDVPLDVLQEILLCLPLQKIADCRLLCRAIKRFIDESSLLQYLKTLFISGYVDLAPPRSSYAQRTELLNAHVHRWLTLDWHCETHQRPMDEMYSYFTEGTYFSLLGKTLTRHDLPSRLRRTPYRQTQLDLSANELLQNPQNIECDKTQDLMVLLDIREDTSAQDCFTPLIHIRTLNNGRHPLARQSELWLSERVAHPARCRVEIYENLVAYSYLDAQHPDFIMVKLVDWKTGIGKPPITVSVDGYQAQCWCLLNTEYIAAIANGEPGVKRFVGIGRLVDDGSDGVAWIARLHIDGDGNTEIQDVDCQSVAQRPPPFESHAGDDDDADESRGLDHKPFEADRKQRMVQVSMKHMEEEGRGRGSYRLEWYSSLDHILSVAERCQRTGLYDVPARMWVQHRDETRYPFKSINSCMPALQGFRSVRWNAQHLFVHTFAPALHHWPAARTAPTVSAVSTMEEHPSVERTGRFVSPGYHVAKRELPSALKLIPPHVMVDVLCDDEHILIFQRDFLAFVERVTIMTM